MDWISWISFGIGCAIGVLAFNGLKWLVEEYQTRRWVKKRNAENAAYAEKVIDELNDDLDNHLAWMLTSGVDRERVIDEIHHHIWGDDRENLAAFMEIAYNQLCRDTKSPLEDAITLRGFVDKWHSEVTLDVAIRKEFMPDDTERYRAGSDILNSYEDWVHDTYGEMGEMDLHMSITFGENEESWSHKE